MARRSDVDTSNEIVRLMVLQLRIQVGSQSNAIIELSRAGFAPIRIAELLGTTQGTVNVALQRAKKTAAQARTGRGRSGDA